MRSNRVRGKGRDNPFPLQASIDAPDPLARRFREVEEIRLAAEGAIVTDAQPIESTLETFDIASETRQAIHRERKHFEAPNWSRDGRSPTFHRNRRICVHASARGVPETIDTGFAVHCDNDHRLSPSGSELAIRDQSADGEPRIYLLPVTGGCRGDSPRTSKR